MYTNWEDEFEKLLAEVKALQANAEKRSGGWDNGFPDGEASACEDIADLMEDVIKRDEAEEAKRQAQRDADEARERQWEELKEIDRFYQDKEG